VPNPAPTGAPSLTPTAAPSPLPSLVPIPAPTQPPAVVPTPAPSTSVPTMLPPTSLPTAKPSPARDVLATASADATTTTTLLAAGIGVLVGSWLMYCARKFFCKRRLRERGHRENTSEDWFTDASALPATAVATEIDAGGGNAHMVDAVAVLEMADVKGGPPVLAEATVLGSAGGGRGNDKNTLDGLMSENQYDRAREKIEADESSAYVKRSSRSGSSSQGRSAMRRLSASLSRSLRGGEDSYEPIPAGAAAEEQWDEPLDDTGGLATYVESHAVADDTPRRSSDGSHMPFPTIAPPPRAPEVRRPSGAASQADRDLAESALALAAATGEREFTVML